MRALRFIRSVPRWLLVRYAGSRWPSLRTGPFSCIQFTEVPPPELPADDWAAVRPRLSGICGSDLSAVACKGSPYFSPFISTPFVLGHETVGEVTEVGSNVPEKFRPGTRVVVEPALGCAVRGIEPPCASCAAGNHAGCTNILKGRIAGGIQTGYCRSTGGAWSERFVVHASQLFAVPKELSDEEAVLAEPYACSLHAALKLPREKGVKILVLGCGPIGLAAIFAYRTAGGQGRVWACDPCTHRSKTALELGADESCSTRGYEELYAWVMERTGATLHRPELGKPVLLGGVDAVLDCVGSARSLDDALRLARPRGAVVVAGMPGIPAGVDWTSLWYKELRVEGSYAYGWEEVEGRRVRTPALALEHLVGSKGRLKPLVNRFFPPAKYREALAAAYDSGRSGAFKTVFDFR